MPPALHDFVVDVVSCRLDPGPAEVAALRRCLSAAERARAERLHSEALRERFVVAHGRLRQILGALGGRAPAALEFDAGRHGKPALQGGSRLRFNLTHSADLMLCAVTLDHEVGIDVEQVRDDLDHVEIARRFFAEDESRPLAALAPDAAREAFFACWTSKEAVVKATGDGISRPLTSYTVSIDPRSARMLATMDPALGSPDEWSLVTVPVSHGYHGTMAVRAPVVLRLWSWPVPWVDGTKEEA